MVNLRAGLLVAVGTVIVLIIELILFPVALTFLSGMNSTCVDYNATSDVCQGGGRQWITASDRALLGNIPTLFVVMVIFTVISGVILTVLFAVKSK